MTAPAPPSSLDSDDSQEPDGSEARVDDFFDDEAIESPGFSQQSYDSEQDKIEPFPFLKLPAELRLQIWNHFCPDLAGAPRILDFHMKDSLAPARGSIYRVVGPGLFLEATTLELRRVLAVHRESRALAEQVFPDELRFESLNGEEVPLRSNLKKDIALITILSPFHDAGGEGINMAGFADKVINLAVVYDSLTDEFANFQRLCLFTCLKRLFLYIYNGECFNRFLKDEVLRWCISKRARQNYLQAFEEGFPIRQEITNIVCWPDADKDPAFVKTHLPKWHIKSLSQSHKDALLDRKIELYPMVIFDEEGLENFGDLVDEDCGILKVYNKDVEDEFESYFHPTYPGSSDEEADIEAGAYHPEDIGMISDDYESDGIDDGELEIIDTGEDYLDDGESVVEDPVSDRHTSDVEADDLPTRSRKRRNVSNSGDDEESGHGPSKRARVHPVDDSDLSDGPRTLYELFDSDEGEDGEEDEGDHDNSGLSNGAVEELEDVEDYEEEEEYDYFHDPRDLINNPADGSESEDYEDDYSHDTSSQISDMAETSEGEDYGEDEEDVQNSGLVNGMAEESEEGEEDDDNNGLVNGMAEELEQVEDYEEEDEYGHDNSGLVNDMAEESEEGEVDDNGGLINDMAEESEEGEDYNEEDDEQGHDYDESAALDSSMVDEGDDEDDE